MSVIMADSVYVVSEAVASKTCLENTKDNIINVAKIAPSAMMLWLIDFCSASHLILLGSWEVSGIS